MTVCAFTSHVYLLKMVYSGNNETGVLEVLEISFLHHPAMVGKLSLNFLKI